MPRKDLTEERTAQILDAFERCVVRRGLGGTSLEDVATEAGVKRSIIRHYIGNRDELVGAMALRYADRYLAYLDWLGETAAGPDRVEALLDALFPRTPTSTASDVVLFEALIGATDEYPDAGRLMTKLVRKTVDRVAAILEADFAEADPKDVWNVAYGVVGVSFNHDSLVQLALPPKYRRGALDAARRLIASLA